MAGAKAYAAKLAISPMATKGFMIVSSQQRRQTCWGSPTRNNTSPPDRTLQIREPFTLKAMSFGRMHQPLYRRKPVSTLGPYISQLGRCFSRCPGASLILRSEFEADEPFW